MLVGGGLGCLVTVVALAMVVAAWRGGGEASDWLWGLCALGLVTTMLSYYDSEARLRAYQQRRNRRACAIRDEVLAGRNPARPYFVYLRPFAVDGAFVEAPRNDADERYVEAYGWPSAHHDLESALALLVYRHSDLVALSDDPGRAGAGYVRSSELTWQQEVAALCAYAEGIFIVPFDFEGTAWEVAMIDVQGWRTKTFVVMPAKPPLALAGVGRHFERLWEAGRVRYPALGLPAYDAGGCIVDLGDDMAIYRGFGAHKTIGDGRARRHDLAQLAARLVALSSGNGPAGGCEGRETADDHRAPER